MSVHLTETPVLRTRRLALRAPQPADYPVWEAFFLSPRGTFIGGGPDHDAGRAWRAFASLIGHWVIRGCGPFVLTRAEDGAVLGACGPWFPALWPEREMSWTVWAPEAEGKGYMTEAAGAILDHAFGALGWSTAVSYIDPDNARSRALAERLGARPDPKAAAPKATGPVIVYRHPRPESRP